MLRVAFSAKQVCPTREFLWLEQLLSKMAEDRDSRVRIAAVKGLSALAASGHLLSFYMYQQVKSVCFVAVMLSLAVFEIFIISAML